MDKITGKTEIVLHALPQDNDAAQNWHFITMEAYNWNCEAIEQYMMRHCEFSKRIEELKDEYDLTYAEITEILLGP